MLLILSAWINRPLTIFLPGLQINICYLRLPTIYFFNLYHSNFFLHFFPKIPVSAELQQVWKAACLSVKTKQNKISQQTFFCLVIEDKLFRDKLLQVQIIQQTEFDQDTRFIMFQRLILVWNCREMHCQMNTFAALILKSDMYSFGFSFWQLLKNESEITIANGKVMSKTLATLFCWVQSIICLK